MSKNWPRLTETAQAAREWGRCSSCGSTHADALSLWQECDENDRPEERFLYLCHGCSELLIESHPRLYSRLNRWYPAPGAMRICVDCRHRDGLRCRSPKALFNGGTVGLAIDAQVSGQAFVDGTRNGRRTGWVETMFAGPPKACAGWEAPRKEKPKSELDGEIDL